MVHPGLQPVLARYPRNWRRPPWDDVVRQAFSTSDGLAINKLDRNRELIETWIDPTRAQEIKRRDRSSLATDHHKANFASLFLVDDAPRKSRARVNAPGVHAAVMAYAALRRAVARTDPRDLLYPPKRNSRPDSPFHEIEAYRGRGGWSLTLYGEGSRLHAYQEQADLSNEVLLVLRAIDKLGSATAPAIAEAVSSLAAGRRHSDTPDSVVKVINEKINERFGVRLIESVRVGRANHYELSAPLRIHE